MKKIWNFICIALLMVLFVSAQNIYFAATTPVLAIDGEEEDDCPPPKCCCGASCGGHVGTCSGGCECTSGQESSDTQLFNTDQSTTAYSAWLIQDVFEAHVLPSMMLMAQSMTVMAMQQVEIIGTFFDAKHQLESQRLLQDLQAQAHKEYQPSTGMCRFGTNTRSLASTDRNAEFNQIGLATRSTQRILMAEGAIGTGSTRDDSRSRLVQFRTTYCNPKDFGNALDLLCTSSSAARRNKDVNYTHNIENEDTLLINFGDAIITEEEEDVLALSANLYGNRLIPRISDIYMADRNGNVIIAGASAYMDTRAHAAKRSVAFNSFAAQAAMRSEGAPSTAHYMTQILEEMGIPLPAIERMLRGAPSYNAQMEILTKKLYQHPNFYSDLYDKPINVDRKDTSIQAIGLMQKRDMYRSQLRSEANMSVWLETLVEDLQEYQANEAKKLTADTNILTNLGL